MEHNNQTDQAEEICLEVNGLWKIFGKKAEDILKYNKKQLRDFRRHTTGMVFQYFGLFSHRTVLYNVAYGLKVSGVSREERLSKAQETIETVELKGWENYHPSALSGGMQQRVGIARA